MEEIRNLLIKYRDVDVDHEIASFAKLVTFSTQFYRDVSEIYDAVTRIRNIERNPTGFDFNDAAILGLLIRIWKILKEVVHYYENNNAQIISLLGRPLIEAAVVAKYLLISDASVIEDYRKCSYKDRLKILNESEDFPVFFKHHQGLGCYIRPIKNSRRRDSREIPSRFRRNINGKCRERVSMTYSPQLNHQNSTNFYTDFHRSRFMVHGTNRWISI